MRKIMCALFGHKFEDWVKTYTLRVRGNKTPVRRNFLKCKRCKATQWGKSV